MYADSSPEAPGIEDRGAVHCEVEVRRDGSIYAHMPAFFGSFANSHFHDKRNLECQKCI